MKFDINIKDALAKQACDNIKYVCNEYPMRDAGSKGEEGAQRYYENRLSSLTPNVNVEEFSVHPLAYMGWSYTSATCMLLAFATYFFSCMVSVLFVLCAAVPLIAQFICQSRFFDPLYPHTTSHNVTALKKCSGECKRTIYFVAHADASHEWRVSYRLGSSMTVAVIVMFILSMVYMFVLSITRWAIVGGLGASIAVDELLHAGAMGAFFLPFIIATYFLISTKRVVDGANENLSGCEVALATLEALDGVQFEGCDVGVIITGGSKVGLRGAKAWCDAHAKEIDANNTVFVNLTTLREIEHLHVNNRELNFTLATDADVVELVKKSALDMQFDIKVDSMMGASDSAAFLQAGLKSASISGINKHRPDYLHTRYDNRDNVSESCIAKSIELTLQMVQNFAQEGDIAGVIDDIQPQEDLLDENTAGIVGE